VEDIQAAAASMRSTAEDIQAEVQSMPRDCIRWKPAPEVWTVMDNLCHIAEFVPYWTHQVSQAITSPEQEWGRTHHDPDRLAAVAETHLRDLASVLRDMQEGVAKSTAALEQLTPDQLATRAPSRNPRWGLQPASFIVDNLLVTHLRKHLSQIRRNRAQYEQERPLPELFPLPSPPLVPTADGNAFPVRRVFCVGRNYAAHAREMGRDPDREPPFFFTKWAETVVPSGSTISYPSETGNFHYEGELVVAIGKAGANISPANAYEHVYGYATGLDMTRRDLQLQAREQGRPWDTAKNVAQSSPIGTLHPASTIGHPERGRITLTVDGEVKQNADLVDMIWSVPDVIAFLSRLYRLEQGDLIYTGTPAGVGPVVPGNKIEVAIDGLESLTITIGPPAA
jgi:fumarylpyruvate hydrolase